MGGLDMVDPELDSNAERLRRSFGSLTTLAMEDCVGEGVRWRIALRGCIVTADVGGAVTASRFSSSETDHQKGSYGRAPRSLADESSRPRTAPIFWPIS